jgi:hypothetical protein
MRDPRHYINQIQSNLKKIQTQPAVTPADSALFEMVDGLAGLTLTVLERLTVVEQQLGLQTTERRAKRPRPAHREERMPAPNPRPTPQPGRVARAAR